MSGPQVSWLADGRRLHMNHGPIDLIVEAFGAEEECREAYRQAVARFDTMLDELVAELPELRKPVGRAGRRFVGTTSRRMERAAFAFRPAFVTPMAAVAGAVADEVLAAMVEGRNLHRAYVNDGGDIAIHLDMGAAMEVAIAGTRHGFSDSVRVEARHPVRGIATSGWRGRSHSLGIADAVTVLAIDGATADAAATLIANAVDLPGHRAITRVPASRVDPDSDLGDRPVTEAVGVLSSQEVRTALEAGLATARTFARDGRIAAAALFLNGENRVCGALEDTLCAAIGQEEETVCHA